MLRNSLKSTIFILVALFVFGCSSEKKEPLVTTPIPIINPEKDISPEEFEAMLKKQAEKDIGSAILLEQFATEETRKEIGRLQKEKEILVAEIEKEKKSKEIFREGVKILEEEKKQLSQQVSQLNQEREQIKKLSDLIPAYQQKISVLETEVLALKKEQVNIQSKKEEMQKPPSVVSIENENAQTVPVRLENSHPSNAYFKITNKKTKKFFIYEVLDGRMPGGMMPGGIGSPSKAKTINLVPGEYTVQITSRNSPPGFTETFTVSEEPIADIGGEKVHAVLKY